MKQIMVMALKDLKLIFRDKMALFFIVGFPVLMGLFFGLVMGGPSTGQSTSKIKVAVIDQDNSEPSRKFVASLAANNGLDVATIEMEEARDSVRKGKRVGMIVLPKGFGERAGIFWGEPPVIQLVMDDSRTAEGAMMEGFIMQAVGELVGDRFQNPRSMLPSLEESRKQAEEGLSDSPAQRMVAKTLFDSLDSMIESFDKMQNQGNDPSSSSPEESQSGMGGMQFADIQSSSILRDEDPSSISGQLKKRNSRWDISFPQAMLWGVLSCVTGFAISIARERTMGTFTRLQVAPINKSSILLGKALACFLASLAVVALMTALGVMLGMRPYSYPKLLAATVCIATAFTGLMMVVSVLGKTEQSVSGAGMAIIMMLAMIGGCMIPAMFLPGFLQTASFVSPVRWAIQAIEGAVWRQFSWAEMMPSMAVLLACGAVSFAIGTTLLHRQQA